MSASSSPSSGRSLFAAAFSSLTLHIHLPWYSAHHGSEYSYSVVNAGFSPGPLAAVMFPLGLLAQESRSLKYSINSASNNPHDHSRSQVMAGFLITWSITRAKCCSTTSIGCTPTSSKYRCCSFHSFSVSSMSSNFFSSSHVRPCGRRSGAIRMPCQLRWPSPCSWPRCSSSPIGCCTKRDSQTFSQYAPS